MCAVSEAKHAADRTIGQPEINTAVKIFVNMSAMHRLGLFTADFERDLSSFNRNQLGLMNNFRKVLLMRSGRQEQFKS